MKRSVCLLAGILMFTSPAGSSGGDHAHAGIHGGTVNTVGQHHLELVVDELHGTLTLYVLGRRGDEAHPVAARTIAARVTPAVTTAWSKAFDIPLGAIPLDGDPPGRTSRFVGSAVELAGLDPFDLEVRLFLDGQTRTTQFSIDPSEISSSFVCPMRCEQSRAYTSAGRCPVCKMQLAPLEAAHGDHSPKHGGVLFMAPDGWHHIEGVLARQELRLYLYNDFTQPIPARAFVTGSSAAIRATAGSAVSGRTIAFVLAGEGEYLSAPMPRDLPVPLDVEVRLQFQGRPHPDSFNFRFDSRVD